VFGKIAIAGARINRLLRPSTSAARYSEDGRVYSIEELVDMLKGMEKGQGHVTGEGQGQVSQEELMKALALRSWETHQRGYVAWYFQSPRYRMHELFGWVRDMMGDESNGPEWLMERFRGR
jgi:hypothetical protein